MLADVNTVAYVGRSAEPFTPSADPMWFIPMASSGKNCDNPHGFPFWRTQWQPDTSDEAERPVALTGVFNTVNRGWDQGYRRFMFHRFGGDQAGGAYSNAQWWTFPEEQRFWYMRDDFDPQTGVPMGMKAFIAQKKAEDPSAEFYIYLGFVMLKVDSLIQEEAPFSETIAHYAECDPTGEDPLELIPEDVHEYDSRSICLEGEDNVGRANQLWLTLGAYVEMGFSGAYYDALGSGEGAGSVCAGDVARLPQYAANGFRMGIEPMAVGRDGQNHYAKHEYLPHAPSVSNYRFLRARVQPKHDRIANPSFDLRGTGAEAAVIIRDTDWEQDASVGARPEGRNLTIERLYQMVRHGYTPMGYASGAPRTVNGIAMVTGVGEAECPADINFDGQVTPDDILTFVDRFLSPVEMVNNQHGLFAGDYQDDDRLDLQDINGFIAAYLNGCE